MATKQKTDQPQPSRVEILTMMLADALLSTETGESVAIVRERVLQGVGDDERANIERLINQRRQFYAQLD